MPAPLPAPGHMGVDYEQRVDFARLRDYRLGRAKESLAASECGAFLLGQLHVGAGEVVRVALLTGLYNAVLTPILFPVIRRVAEASRAKKVFRW